MKMKKIMNIIKMLVVESKTVLEMIKMKKKEMMEI